VNPGHAREKDDVHLRAATAVMGYAVQTEGGEIGPVKDVLVDDRAWAIRYLVVAIENPWAGKDASKTLCCIATAIADGDESGGAWKTPGRARGAGPR